MHTTVTSNRRIGKPWDTESPADENLCLRRKLDHAKSVLIQVENHFTQVLAGSQEQVHKMADLVADIAHEVVNPLNAVAGFSELLIDEKHGPLGDPRYQDYAQTIHETALQLKRIAEEHLEAARCQSSETPLALSMVQTTKVIEQTVKLYKKMAENEGVELQCKTPGEFPPLRLDEGKFRRVLSNLIINAIKFSPQGGRVSVECRKDPGANAMVFVISDTGCGITPEKLPLVLSRWGRAEEFEDLLKNKKGFGLGLSLSGSLVERMGGTMEISSRPGQGTAIRIVFPWDLTT